MTQEQLISYKINKFMMKRDTKGICDLIMSLCRDVPSTLQGIIDEMATSKNEQLVLNQQAQVKIQEDIDKINAIDLNSLTQNQN